MLRLGRADGVCARVCMCVCCVCVYEREKHTHSSDPRK